MTTSLQLWRTSVDVDALRNLSTARMSDWVDFEIAFAGSGIGLSSRGLVNWALRGGGDPDDYDGFWPSDADDLGRCERAFTAAPDWLGEPMELLLEAFRVRVAENEAAYTTASTAQVTAADAAAAARRAEVAADASEVVLQLDARRKRIVAAALALYADEVSDEGVVDVLGEGFDVLADEVTAVIATLN